MGVLAVEVGRLTEALPFLKTALEINPSKAQFWFSYIDALIKLRRIEDAKDLLAQARRMGADGEGFEQIEKRLGSVTSKKLNAQEPSRRN